MSMKTLRTTKYLAGAVLLASLLGCGLSTELFNPDFFSSLGIDAQSIARSPGRIVLAFRNYSNATIVFASATYTDRSITQFAQNEAEFTASLRLADVQNVAANETRTLVLDCPVRVIVPGGITAVTDESAADVTYQGSLLVVDEDYECGDVIEMGLVQTGDTADSLTLQVRVLPGR